MESNGKQDGDPLRAHTPEAVQHKLDCTLEERIRFYAAQPKEVLSRRIRELEQEWDLERVLLCNGRKQQLGSLG